MVFHGGSGSSKEEFSEAIGYGVVKVNVDTDMQFAYLSGIRDYVLKNKDYLMTQVGNPEAGDKPNKKYYDPRVSPLLLLAHPTIKLIVYIGLGS